MITPHGKYDLKLLQSIKDFYLNKTTKIQDDDNILIKYLKSPDIIRDFKTDNLFLFINELLDQIEDSNIILPFIEPIGDLIDIYINTEDNKIEDSTWETLFVKLLENSFFNKENLIPIYSYFTELYSDVDTINESDTDERMYKFKKCINLWKWIYLSITNIKKIYNQPVSTFCSLGSGLELLLPIDFPDKLCLNIRINLANEDFLEYVNPNDAFIKVGVESINYKYLLYRLKNKKIKYFDFQFKVDNMEKILWFYINKSEFKYIIYLKHENSVSFLHNFFGQIESIIISFYDYEKNGEYNKKTIYPYPIKDSYKIIFNSYYNIKRIVTITQIEDYGVHTYPERKNFNFKFQIQIQNKDLFKTNFINYKEMQFDIINYFGGIIQFLPFLNIINGIYNNKAISYIDKKDKKEVLIDFAKNILLVIFNYENNEKNEKRKSLENYWTFFLYVITIKSKLIKF